MAPLRRLSSIEEFVRNANSQAQAPDLGNQNILAMGSAICILQCPPGGPDAHQGLSATALPHHLALGYSYRKPALLSLGLFACLLSVSVCSGCYNTVPQTEYFINNRNLFLIVLEAESPRSECQHGQSLVRTLFWVAGC